MLIKYPEFDVELLERIHSNPWLQPREKTLFELKYKQGLLNYQIAEIMHCSTETVSRMLKKLLTKSEPIILDYLKAKSQ